MYKIFLLISLVFGVFFVNTSYADQYAKPFIIRLSSETLYTPMEQSHSSVAVSSKEFRETNWRDIGVDNIGYQLSMSFPGMPRKQIEDIQNGADYLLDRNFDEAFGGRDFSSSFVGIRYHMTLDRKDKRTQKLGFVASHDNFEARSDKFNSFTAHFEGFAYVSWDKDGLTRGLGVPKNWSDLK